MQINLYLVEASNYKAFSHLLFEGIAGNKVKMFGFDEFFGLPVSLGAERDQLYWVRKHVEKVCS